MCLFLFALHILFRTGDWFTKALDMLNKVWATDWFPEWVTALMWISTILGTILPETLPWSQLSAVSRMQICITA